MKKKYKIPDLSRAEFDILSVLWKKSPLSVREVHDLLQGTQNWAYTTTKTMMDRMAQKDLLERQEFHRIYLYKPLISRVQGLVKWVTFFTERVLETDYNTTVSMFAKSKNLSTSEIDELRALIERQHEKGERDD